MLADSLSAEASAQASAAGTIYAKDNIRVNAVAPGVVHAPLHRDTPRAAMEDLSPMGRPSTVKDIADAVRYLTEAATVTGDILYVDGGSHFGRW
ncbi:MAG TPA: SDR family oxidoreductase [Candidatus Baltobacteraceae bacterium]|nr:SDR family oxidoreductase [Candidatus Baltobacteraceae bacterium]